ncbi:BglII/BstYI family type II restriction endonuclease [Paenibacillus chibensis]|uniref:BglII/BstYI family type II restriction endonuclease n=1 Tax=Paenibacillus chibensis TaxID=59846 RepID=UPI000FDBFA2F|nr:BglII/BstYI family type II restriction endonuclease [Paenibacillus chibensis]MEC0371127.1 BglII/BstYI family type II restriction endonuclease [Paenibacillus chibensis]
MALDRLPREIREKFDVVERNHASGILQSDFVDEYEEILEVLSKFELTRIDILKPGGRKSPISEKLDGEFYDRGWVEKKFDINITIDDIEYPTPTHKVDCFKEKQFSDERGNIIKKGIGLEIEWNNKDPFFDRDLSNFRLLHELGAISVGIIITRAEELQDIFNNLGKGSSYGASTTHYGKLKKRIKGRNGAGCPLLVFCINKNSYVD